MEYQENKMDMFMATVKTVSKYTVNILAIVQALIIGLDPIWGIPYAHEITETLAVIMAVAGTYLLGSKGLTTYQEHKLEDK